MVNDPAIDSLIKKLEARICGKYKHHESFGQGLDHAFHVAIDIIRQHNAEQPQEVRPCEMRDNEGFQEHLNAARNANGCFAITVWKDGCWKHWQAIDAKYAEKDENWLLTIPLGGIGAPEPVMGSGDFVRSAEVTGKVGVAVPALDQPVGLSLQAMVDLYDSNYWRTYEEHLPLIPQERSRLAQEAAIKAIIDAARPKRQSGWASPAISPETVGLGGEKVSVHAPCALGGSLVG